LAAALSVQFEQWRAALGGGAERVGWKLGIGDGERIGDEVALGHLTSATLLDPGAAYAAGAPADLRADVEVALQIGRPVAPDVDPVATREAMAGLGVALEICDLGGGGRRHQRLPPHHRVGHASPDQGRRQVTADLGSLGRVEVTIAG